MERKKLYNILSLVSNVLIIIGVVWSVAFYFYHDDGSGNMLAKGAQCFRFFTIDSNILVAISCAIYLYFNILRCMGKEIQTPLWVKVFRYVAVNSVAVTFFVVLFFLAPMVVITQGLSPWYLYEDNCIILHALAPMLAMLCVILFEKEDRIEKKYTYFSFTTVTIYGIIYFICVVFAKVWPDFYSFTFDGRYYLSPIAAICVFGMAYLGSELVYWLQKVCIDKLPENN